MDMSLPSFISVLYLFLHVCECHVLSVFSSDMFHIQMQSSREWIDEMK